MASRNGVTNSCSLVWRRVARRTALLFESRDEEDDVYRHRRQQPHPSPSVELLKGSSDALLLVASEVGRLYDAWEREGVDVEARAWALGVVRFAAWWGGRVRAEADLSGGCVRWQPTHGSVDRGGANICPNPPPGERR